MDGQQLREKKAPKPVKVNADDPMSNSGESRMTAVKARHQFNQNLNTQMNNLFKSIYSIFNPIRKKPVNQCGTGKESLDNKGRLRGVKAHRRCYFMPIWKQFGYESQPRMDLDRWGVGGCRYYAGDGCHPRAKRAKAALALLGSN